MLVLSRKHQEQICIGDRIRITVLQVKGKTVRLGIEAPASVRVLRGELSPFSECTVETEEAVEASLEDSETPESEEPVGFRRSKTMNRRPLAPLVRRELNAQSAV